MGLTRPENSLAQPDNQAVSKSGLPPLPQSLVIQAAAIRLDRGPEFDIIFSAGD
jgi:hypothetical protein